MEGRLTDVPEKKNLSGSDVISTEIYETTKYSVCFSMYYKK
jgi:hypothetical protein